MQYALKQGLVIELKEENRPPLQFWMRKKMVPAHLTLLYLQIGKGEIDAHSIADEQVNNRTAQELQEVFDFEYACIEHLCEGTSINIKKLTEAEWNDLFRFALHGTIREQATEGGEAAALESFRAES